MSRDGSGTYTLPAGNPVAGGTVITSTWANTTMDDVAIALTDSLDRRGRGGMLAAFRFADGLVNNPGAGWSNEPTSGFYRADPADLRTTILGQDITRWTSSGFEIWDFVTNSWTTVGAAGGRTGMTMDNITVDTLGVAGHHYHITVGLVTVTLPAAPTIGDIIAVSVDNFATNLVDTNGIPLNGLAQIVEMDLVDLYLEFQYVDVTIGWEITSQALSSAVTGGLPAQGTADGNTLVWDTGSERWVETNFLNVGLDQVVSGVVNGDVADQKLTRLTVVAALPGTPAANAMYFIPGGGIYLGSTLIAGTGWEAGGAAESIVNSNTGDVVSAPSTGDVNLIPTLGDVDVSPAAGNVLMTTLPIADPVVSGALWNNAGVLTVSA